MTGKMKEFARELMKDVNRLQMYSTDLETATHFPSIICNQLEFDGKWYFKMEPTEAVDTLNKLFCIAQLYDDEISVKLLNSIFPYEEDETDELIVKFNQEISDQSRKELLDNEIMVQAIKNRIAYHQSISDTRISIKRLRKEAMEKHTAARRNGLQN